MKMERITNDGSSNRGTVNFVVTCKDSNTVSKFESIMSEWFGKESCVDGLEDNEIAYYVETKHIKFFKQCYKICKQQIKNGY